VPPPVVASAPNAGAVHEPVAVTVAALAPVLERTELLELPRPSMTPEPTQTIVMARVAPKLDKDPQLVETRPEPVVQRASGRPKASVLAPVMLAPVTTAPELEPSTSELVRTEPLPLVRPMGAVLQPFVPSELPGVVVAAESRPNLTPLLGTRVTGEDELPTAVPPRVEAESVDPVPASAVLLAEDAVSDPPTLEDPAFDDDGDVDVLEVIFDASDRPVAPPDDVLLQSQPSDRTEPCPPLEAESLPPSASELPPWATASEAVGEFTPPPRVALPERRPSDVEDLLRNLDEVPLAVEDVRAGLRRLAGMEPTPPPPGVSRDG
jgi:hypothetical protein